MINQFIRNFCLKGCKNIKKYRIVLGFELGVELGGRHWAVGIGRGKLLLSSISFINLLSPSELLTANLH